MRRLIAVVYLAFALVLCGHFVSAAYAAKLETNVCVTPYGEKYHKFNCPYVTGEYTTLTVDEAIQRGYEPCSRCSPDDYTATQESTTRYYADYDDDYEDYEENGDSDNEPAKRGVFIPAWVIYISVGYVIYRIGISAHKATKSK